MQEMELKAVVWDPVAVKARIEAFAGVGKAVRKEDLYLRSRRALTTIRMRRLGDKLEVSRKVHAMENGIQSNLEYEFSADAGEWPKVKEFFQAMGYSEYYDKVKDGWEWHYRNVHVELFDVLGVGDFLELEILVPFGMHYPVEKARRELLAVLMKCGVPENDLCTVSYKDLILGV